MPEAYRIAAKERNLARGLNFNIMEKIKTIAALALLLTTFFVTIIFLTCLIESL